MAWTDGRSARMGGKINSQWLGNIYYDNLAGQFKFNNHWIIVESSGES